VAALLEQIRLGTMDAATSPVTFEELDQTPEPLKSKLLPLLDGIRRLSADKDEVERLALAYLNERVIPERYAEDAEHIAYATVCKADVLVSLNLRHLANEWAERRVCAVNLREGYQALSIRTPEEVLEYED
jgi:predicted nucleic acid-binding protein